MRTSLPRSVSRPSRSGRERLDASQSTSRYGIATVSDFYDHAARELPERPTKEFHEHNDLAQATLHVHVDRESCLEITVLRGRSAEVKTFAGQVIALRGVRNGQVVMMPVEADSAPGHTLGASDTRQRR